MDGAAFEQGFPLIAIGAFLLIGFVAHVVGRRAHVPRVMLLLLIGVAAGARVFGLVPESALEWFPLASEVVLSIVGFMLGEQFLGKKLRSVGRVVLSVAIVQTALTALVVFGALVAIGVPSDKADPTRVWDRLIASQT